MFEKNKSSWRRFHPVKILFFIGFVIILVLAVGWVVMFLWNAILPDTIGVKPLTYWKAVGLLILMKILFGGFGGNSNRRPFKKRFQKKWQSMSEEDRARIKAKWKARCERRKREEE